jgi:hypothetical protein
MVITPKLPGLSRAVARILKSLACRHAGAAMIFALSAPMLIGAMGVAIDVGYWYQEQENLQTAADAAAVAAANAEATYSSNVSTAAEAQPFAVQSANVATGGLYNFGTGSATVSVTPTSVSGNTQWTATAAAPRLSFFSAVYGMGVAGFAAGTQAATAAADYVPATPNECLIATQVITYNAAKVQGANCSLYASYSGSCPYNVSSGGVIEGKTLGILTGHTENGNSGCGSGSNNAYVGLTADYVITNPTTIAGVAAIATPSPLVTLGGAPPTGTLQMNTAAAGLTLPTGLCTGSVTITNGQAAGLLQGCKYTTQVNSVGPSSLAIGTSVNPSTLATTGTTLVTGGVISQNGMGPVTMGGAEVYLEDTSYPTDAFDVYLKSSNQSISTQGGTGFQMAVQGTFQFGNCGSNCTGDTLSLGQGTYYFDAGSATSNAIYGNDAMTVTTAAGSTYYVYGETLTQNAAGTWTFNTGTYVFDGLVSLTGGTVNFEGGTYYFEDGLDESDANGATNVTFGPGIYYILGGTLDLNSNNVTANGATFILENGANYEFANQVSGGSMTMNAPNTTNDPGCVQPSAYPEAGYSDGTNGNGICNVLIYQEPSDTAADGIEANNFTYMNGIIYQPGGNLTMSYQTGANAAPGNSTLEASSGSTNDFLEIQSATFSDSNTDVIPSPQSGGGFNAAGSGVLAFLVK